MLTPEEWERRWVLPAARTLSIVFTPFYLPLVAMAALFSLTYLSVLPLAYKLWVVGFTYILTVLTPTMLIHFYRRYHGWTLFHLRERNRRMVPYIIAIIAYYTFYFLLRWSHAPHFMSAIIVAALFVQIVCALTNVWFKISAHTAATGGIVGGIAAFATILGFNPVGWIAAAILVSGLVGTARMMLRIHTLAEIIAGFLAGAVTTFLVVLLV